PVALRKLPQAQIDSRFGNHRYWALRYQEDHKEGEHTGNKREVEHRPHSDMQRVEKKDGQHRAEERARVVTNTFKPKGSTAVFFVHGRCDERITRRRAAAGA